MGIYVAFTIIGAFACFAFIAEQLNPVSKPKSYHRRSRWRYGRRVGCAALFSGCLFIGIQGVVQPPVVTVGIVCGGLFILLWVSIAVYSRPNQIV